MILGPRALIWSLPVALVATGGCLATRSDIEKLQVSVATMQATLRTEQVRSDSSNRVFVESVARQLSLQFSREFGVVSDSLRRIASAVQRLQGDMTLSMHDLRVQIATVQEGVGQSQKRIQDLRTSVEATAAAPPVVPPRVAEPLVPAGVPAGATSANAPPAAQLFVAAIDQLRRGATAAAREGLSTLITEYPTHEKAAEAQMLIADAYAQEGNRIAADSVYALVINKYAGPPEVISRSIYKRAMALKEVGQTTESLKLFQTIVDKYPRADVHDLAVEMIRTLKKP